MERHRCNLCFRRFASGRALGGHMRSHVTPRPTRAPPLPPSHSASSSSFSAAEAAADDDTAAAAGLGYGLRENPRKSFRLVDPEFSSTFAAADGGGGGGGGGSSSVVQDRESETESSLPPPFRRRSKRSRRLHDAAVAADAEPLSSISDVSPEEDVARCLMLLSRDAWARLRAGEEPDDQQSDGWDETAEDEDYNDDGEDGDERIGVSARSRRRGRRSRYQCGTCKKFFRSYQALGGHRAGHKKVAGSGCVPAAGGIQIGGEDSSETNADRNSSLHRCPFCSRVFGSAQALGGHKRSHLASSSSPIAAASAAHSPPLPPPPLSANNSSTNLGGEGFIDLNQPAPLEEEVELSALSDATELQSK